MFIAAKYEEMYAPEIGKLKIKTFSRNFLSSIILQYFQETLSTSLIALIPNRKFVKWK